MSAIAHEKTDSLVADLVKSIGGEQVQFDHMTRVLYSTDASNYQVMPVGVTFPRNADDVVAVHAVAQQYGVPVLPRGGGSGLAGGGIGEAIIMDFSRHMRRVRGVNAETCTVDVEPGLVLDQMNRSLAPLNLMFGPDPASSSRATMGGCIGNNSSGSHSIVYGMTADHVKRLQVVLANGELVWTDADHATLNAIREKVGGLVRQHQDEIAARYPKTWRTVAGYALNKIDPDNVNLNWLLTGSEGTLGTIVRAELNLVTRPTAAQKRLAIVHFDTLRQSLEATPHILELKPNAVELMDRYMLDRSRESAFYSKRLTFVDGNPDALLFVEFVADTPAQLTAKVNDLKSHMARLGYRGAITVAETATEQNNIWEVRKGGMGLIMSARGDAKPVTFVEDAAVPVENLADFISDVESIIHEEGTQFAVYAHASAGCLHVRPLVNMKTLRGMEQYRSIADRVTEKVVQYQGTITGEHGQGLVRGEHSAYLFGETLMEVFREVKAAFDPDNLMNPGKVVDAPKMDDPAILRYTPDYEVIPLKTRFDWDADYGLNGAVEMCNGAGVCRKEGVGTMCPSFQATKDEAHSTRGRANALRAAITGNLPDGLSSEALKDVFSLCLSCKACKSECPSSVDVARIKAEYMALYHDEHGVPLSTQLFGNIHRVNQLAGRLPALSNFMMNNSISQAGMRLFGIPTDRPMPQYASQRFSATLRDFTYDAPDATLIVDTFTEWNHPEVGTALMTIAAAVGLKINVRRLPNQGCCGRPAISKGLLDTGRRMATDNVRGLSQPDYDAPYIFLEPSCLSAFTDDYPALVDKDLQSYAAALAENCITPEVWLADVLAARQDELTWDREPRKIMLHGHCHQKALWGTQSTLNLLRLIPNADVSEIQSGCCGVAGSFGYEHYDVSMTIANDWLLPAIEANSDAIIAAPGTSCRAQIHDAGCEVVHPLEIVAAAMR